MLCSMHVSAFLVFLDFLQTLAKIYCVWKCVDFTQKFSAPAAKLDLYLCFAHCVFGQVIMRGVLYARSCLSLSLLVYPPCLNIAKWFSHSRRIAAALLESIRPADLWPSLMYVYPFLLTLHCAKTPTRSWYPGKCSNLLPTTPFPLSRYPLLAAPRPVINKWFPWEGTRKLKLQKRKTSSRY